jgi:endoglucanase
MNGLDRREVMLRLGGAALVPAAASGALAADPWTAFKARYLAPEGRIVDTGNGGISHSEGQGYGMLLAQAGGDRDSFDRLWRWTSTNLARPGDALFSWRFEPASAVAVSDPNNAADGDLLIAWALLRAARAWREPLYEGSARRILKSLAELVVVDAPVGKVLLPGLQGFQAGDAATLNLSYWVWPAFSAFATFDPQGPWAALSQAGKALLDRAGFGAMRLPTDWVDLSADGNLAPAAGRPPRFGFDAVRIPLYLAWAGDRARLAPFQAFWRPLLQAAKRPPAWIDVVTSETSPYAASNGATAVAEWICGVEAPAGGAQGDYYGDALAALTALARREAARFSPWPAG